MKIVTDDERREIEKEEQKYDSTTTTIKYSSSSSKLSYWLSIIAMPAGVANMKTRVQTSGQSIELFIQINLK